MIRKLSSLLLCIVMVLSLTACGAEKTSPVTLVDSGSTDFTIIYPEGANDSVLSAVDYLKTELASVTSASFDAYEDMAVGSGDGKNEILVGMTDRTESTEALQNMNYSGDYSVTVSGTKVVIAAMLDTSLMEAAEKFVEDVQSKLSNGTVTLAGDYSNLGSDDSVLQYLPTYNYGTLQSSYDCGNDAMMLIYDYDETGLASYGSDLEDSGFAKYTENTIGENQFATYTNEENNVEVNIMVLPAMESVRIVAEPGNYLPATSAEEVTATVTPSVTMIGLENYDTSGSPNQIGMSMVYQLSDGSFLVIDGGHNNDTAADNLYNTMASLAPDPNNIVVAAWVLTHGHADHVNNFLGAFTEKYSDKITLELLVHNFPSQADFDAASESVTTTLEKLDNCIATYGCDVMKMHAGQILYVRDAKITCYCSMDLVVPQSLEYFNNTSLVFSVELAGQKIMMLADCGPLETDVLQMIYTQNELKSDVCQIGHHGYMGASSDLYKMIAPDYLLWPGGSRSYEEYKDETYHVWVLKNCKQLWIAGKDITTLTLPIS